MTLAVTILTQSTSDRRRPSALRSRSIWLVTAAFLLFCVTAANGHAQTCVTQAQMSGPERDGLAAVARKMSANVLAGDAAALRDSSTPELQKDFAGVAQAITDLSDARTGAVTIRSIYLLDNSTAQTSGEVAQFFCGAYNTPMHVTFTLSDLKAGRYAVVTVHVTGVESPRQLSYVLQDLNGWKLAGFIAKPLFQGGHDGVWHWQRARELQRKHESWNAELSFQIAKQLLTPVGFLSSANLEKLATEEQAAQPGDWPTELRPLVLTVDGKQVKVMEMAPVISARNTADLSISLHVEQEDGGDPATSNARNQAVVKELVRKIPELRELFSLIVVTEVSTKNAPQTTIVSLKSIP